MTHSLVVGGTRGLGRVVARQLAARGDVVSLLGRSDPPAEDLGAGKIRPYRLDLDDVPAVTRTVAKLVETSGPVDYCVFLQRYRGKDDDWAGEFNTTLTATKRMVELLTPSFSPSGDRAVVMVSSVFARYVGEGQSLSYHVAKAGLDQMMRYYALNLGGRGIRVNGITPFTFLKEESRKFYVENQPLMDLYKTIIPLNRLGTTEDSSNVIVFLCSPQAGFVNGQNITVDGGLSLAWPETLARRLKQL
jgi:NAD(P)-dependent dehydrogenase (short-subunit alcohol dehydrogenase family)